VLLQEADELVEVLLGWEVMTAVGPDGLEDAVLGDQPPGGRRRAAGQEAGVLELALLLPAHVERPAGAEHEDPLGLVGGVHEEAALQVRQPPVFHDHFVGGALVLNFHSIAFTIAISWFSQSATKTNKQTNKLTQRL
jgi:hypothetical protein